MSLVARAADPPDPYIVPPSKQFDGNDGSWSTFKVSAGTPGQDFRLLPSTKAGVTYLVAPEGCLKGVDPDGCQQARGVEVFQSSQNIGFQVNATTSWSAIGQYAVDLEDALNITADGIFGFDSVSLGAAADSTSLSLTHQVVAGVADPSYYLGVLPLGQAASSFSSLSKSTDSLLFQLRNASKIPSLSYAYTAGAKYRLKSVFGNLVLGGFDSTRFKPNDNDFSFTFSTDPSRLLTVSVASIMGTNTLKGTFSLTSNAHFSVVDSTVSQLWLPKDVCAQFEVAFGLTYDPRTDLYLVNDTIHQQLLSKNPTLTIKLANSLQGATTNYTNIQLPYAAFDLQASYPFYPNATNYFPIRRAANDTQYVLGRTLLQEAYLIVDYERANFTIAQAVFPDPLPAANVITISPPNTTSSKNSSGLPLGAVIGIAIGGAILLVAAILALFFLCKRRRRPRRERRHELADKNTPDSSHHLTSSFKSAGAQEIGGTPLMELAGPPSAGHSPYSDEQKRFVSVVDTPQELHAESRVPVTPRWLEVTGSQPPSRYEADGASNASRSVSLGPSDDGGTAVEQGARSGVSPLTPQFRR